MRREKCAICHSETQYHRGTPINHRNFYIEGVGQLCKPCFHTYENDMGLNRNQKTNPVGLSMLILGALGVGYILAALVYYTWFH